ncbi:DHS-like NAD/FAD-binding domain-containing protein [Suillus fuscotomentosus]|uniref:DHS-like NAD/FAD-binding domain-containing protein n=1 Tax=Suillus fuscotomentosus TaxID=1912939 RepID=A0AAD4HRA4_9AGAM|nr:DHS-like NAD/FAD-binding domain-containing protein [Suillus fuscotomentosus]KAG1904649.1 DHS-like NAD/FAD-binding domain-containing protein [Suillus fuscotomentosus]
MTISLPLDAVSGESSTRRALSDISLAVAKSKKIIVVTGAGISCSCGIPDFRSSDGLYSLVKQRYPDIVLKGRDLFDASLFRNSASTSVFYTFISQLKRSIDAATPAPTHRFIQTLDAKHKLVRSYTQNIDGLEERIGLRGSSSQQAKTNGKKKSKLKVKEVRNVQLHGDIHRVRCTLCSAEMPCTEEHLHSFENGKAPNCPECTSRSEARVARSARALKIGTLRPAIVLYDEPHPLGDDIGTIQTIDIARKPDMLIIMGTSLKVHGLKKLVKDFAKVVHATGTGTTPSGTPKVQKSWQGKVIFVNKTPPGSEWSDIIDCHVAGETDAWVDKVLEDWKKMRPSDWEIQQTLDHTDESNGFKAVKEITTKTKGKAAPKWNMNVENVPPEDPFFSQPASPSKKPVSVPSSPTKRRQSVSHYSDSESSPRKRRDIARIADGMDRLDMSDRCKLFADATNAPKNAGGDDFLMGELQPSKAKVRRASASVVSRECKPRPRNVAKSKVEMWVEIPKKLSIHSRL